MTEFKAIRRDERGAIEDVAITCEMFRLEKLDKNHWWAAAYVGEGKEFRQVHFDIKSAAGIQVVARDDTIGCTDDTKTN